MAQAVEKLPKIKTLAYYLDVYDNDKEQSLSIINLWTVSLTENDKKVPL